MSKFIVLYHAPMEAMAAMADVSPEQREEGMKAWMTWAEKCGSGLVELGTPLMGGQAVKPDGSSSASEKQVCGYSVLEAENMDAAKALLEGHPHLNWLEQCSIEIHESMPM